jgi:hypothetical protein
VDADNAADQVAIDRRMKEHRRRHDQPPSAIKDDAAEIARLADDGRVAGAIEMIMHLIDQAGDLVAQDLDSDGIHESHSSPDGDGALWRAGEIRGAVDCARPLPHSAALHAGYSCRVRIKL